MVRKFKINWSRTLNYVVADLESISSEDIVPIVDYLFQEISEDDASLDFFHDALNSLDDLTDYEFNLISKHFPIMYILKFNQLMT